jgi:hypothetical protein
MGEEPLPAAVRAAATDRQGGATEVAANALDGLLEVAGEPRRLAAAVAALLAGQPAMAPIWHLARAASGPDPGAALAAMRARLDADGAAAVAAAAAWLRPRLAGGGRSAVATVSHSSLVDRVLASLGPAAGEPRPLVGLVGADAIGPEALLNAAGTGELAARLPTLVVATALKLLPAEPFARLAGPGFETVPLGAVTAVVVGPQVLSPAEAGRLAATMRPA